MRRKSRGRFQKRNGAQRRFYNQQREIVWEVNFLKNGYYYCEECGSSPLYKNKSGETLYRDDLLTADHIIEVSKGGTDHFSNLRTTCARCNNDKSNPRNPKIL